MTKEEINPEEVNEELDEGVEPIEEDAEEIAEELELEKVYLIPAAAPPHKEKRPLTSFQHRLEMVRMAASASPMLEALDMEGRRQGLSYSIETLKEFHRHRNRELCPR